MHDDEQNLLVLIGKMKDLQKNQKEMLKMICPDHYYLKDLERIICLPHLLDQNMQVELYKQLLLEQKNILQEVVNKMMETNILEQNENVFQMQKQLCQFELQLCKLEQQYHLLQQQ